MSTNPEFSSMDYRFMWSYHINVVISLLALVFRNVFATAVLFLLKYKLKYQIIDFPFW